jgi:hypothetical protein
MATQTLSIIRKIMNWHATRSDDFLSPVVRGMARTKPSERARERVLTDDEIRKIWTTRTGVFSDYVRFLLLTAARRSRGGAVEGQAMMDGFVGYWDGQEWVYFHYENPKLSAVMSAQMDQRSFAAALERAIMRSKSPPPVAALPAPEHPASELKGNFPMRRRNLR